MDNANKETNKMKLTLTIDLDKLDSAPDYEVAEILEQVAAQFRALQVELDTTQVLRSESGTVCGDFCVESE